MVEIDIRLDEYDLRMIVASLDLTATIHATTNDESAVDHYTTLREDLEAILSEHVA